MHAYLQNIYVLKDTYVNICFYYTIGHKSMQ